MGAETAPRWLAADGLRVQFAKRRSLAQARYAQFVIEGVKAKSPWSNLKGQVFLGDEQFVQQMQVHLQIGKYDVQIPRGQRRPPAPALAEIARRATDRNAAIMTAHATGGYAYLADRRLFLHPPHNSWADCEGGKYCFVLIPQSRSC